MDENSPKGNLETNLSWLSVVEAELEGLYQLEGVSHAILARRDGLPLAAVPGARKGEKSLAATLAALHGTSDMAMQLSKGGNYLESLVRGEEIEILCVAIGEDAVLGVIAERGALTGLLFMAIEAAARKISRVLETS